MSFVIRHKVERDFTVIQNGLVRDERLRWSDRGLLVFMLHLPPNFVLNYRYLTKASPDGREAVMSTVKRLMTCGYVSMQLERDATGRYQRTIWTVTDTVERPRSGSPESGFPTPDKPTPVLPPSDLPGPAKPESEKPLLISTIENKNSKTTTTTGHGVGGAMSRALDLRGLLEEVEKSAVDTILAALPPDLAQDVIDEVAAMAELGKLHGPPLPMIRSLAVKARSGEFLPILAARFRLKLKREAERKTQQHEERARATLPRSRASMEAAQTALANIRRSIQSKGGADSAGDHRATKPRGGVDDGRNA